VAQRTAPKSRPALQTACWPASQLTEHPPQVVVGGALQELGPRPAAIGAGAVASTMDAKPTSGRDWQAWRTASTWLAAVAALPREAAKSCTKATYGESSLALVNWPQVAICMSGAAACSWAWAGRPAKIVAKATTAANRINRIISFTLLVEDARGGHRNWPEALENAESSTAPP
jgi:hypothetical protein